ncbi:hypothetical protein ACTA71_006037 [Dictyostelium dimigraforme]
MSNILATEKSNIDLEKINYLVENTILLVINSQATISRVRRNNISKEIYGSEVLLPIKIKDTPKMYDEEETERVRKLAKSIRKNNEAKQSLLKQNYHSKLGSKKSVNSGGNTTGNSSNSKSSSGSSGRSNNFNGSPSNVVSEEQEVNLPVGGRLFHHKQVWKELGLPNFCQEVVNGLKIHLLPNFKPILNSTPISIPESQIGLHHKGSTRLVTGRCHRTSTSKPLFKTRFLLQNGRNKNLPSMLKKGYYIVKLDIKKAYLHVLVDAQFRDLFRFVWKGVHYRWKTMPFGLSTAPRIFTILLRPVLRMLRDINVSVITYLNDLLIVAPTKEECLTNLKKTMDLLLKLGFKLNLEKSILEPTQSITSRIGNRLITNETSRSKREEKECHQRNSKFLKSHIQCLTIANGDWDQSFPIPQEVKSEISIWLTVLNQWNGKEISLFPNFDYVLTTDASESGAGATLKKGNTIIKTWSLQWSFRNESQNSQKDQELQLATEEKSIQSHPTSIRSSSNGLIRISPEPLDDQLLDHKDECPPTRLESMETMPGISTTNTATFDIGEDEFLKFDAYVDITDIPDLEISNVVSNDSSSSSSSPNSPISPRTGYIPGSTNKKVDRINSNSNSTTLEAGDYSTFQSHVRSIISTQKAGTSDLLMSSWQPSTLKVHDSSYAKFYSFCTSNNLDPSDITLVVFMDYLTYLFKLVPSLAYATINGHRSMLNQLLHLYNKSDIVNDPFIARLMAGIHKLRPASAKYNEIWDANLVFKYLSKINVLPKFTYSALLHKTLVLCKMFCLARSSDLVKWSLNNLIVSTDSIKGPVINSKEQRNNNNNSGEWSIMNDGE